MTPKACIALQTTDLLNDGFSWCNTPQGNSPARHLNQVSRNSLCISLELGVDEHIPNNQYSTLFTARAYDSRGPAFTVLLTRSTGTFSREPFRPHGPLPGSDGLSLLQPWTVNTVHSGEPTSPMVAPANIGQEDKGTQRFLYVTVTL